MNRQNYEASVLPPIPTEKSSPTDRIPALREKEAKTTEPDQEKEVAQTKIVEKLVGTNGVSQIEKAVKLIEEYKKIFGEEVPDYIIKNLKKETADSFLDILEANWFLAAKSLIEKTNILDDTWLSDVIIVEKIQELEKLVYDYENNNYTGDFDSDDIQEIKGLLRSYNEKISKNTTLENISAQNNEEAPDTEIDLPKAA
ncbi:MAG: hypothetical protein PHQ18_04020 [Patescibacteria group bacterium]|nr:hypothetical protein [Patescibacteria group bacterium]